MTTPRIFDGPSALAHVKDICKTIDARVGRTLAKAAVTAVVVPATMLTLGGCDIINPPVALYGMPMEEICDSGYDDDGDGRTDCDDSDCAHLERCQGCFDGIDNDGDGLADCADSSCAATEACAGCDDELDNDNDGYTDCDDADCAGTEACP